MITKHDTTPGPTDGTGQNAVAEGGPSLPFHADLLVPLADHAVFFDLDGTLLDLAATPDGIIVPSGLQADLEALSRATGGALALVTGRALAYADLLFQGSQFPIAGLHGAERRRADGTVDQAPAASGLDRVKVEIRQQAERLSGVLVEDKGAALAIHVRQAPEHEAAVDRIVGQALEALGDGYRLQRGKCVLEIRPTGADKGAAVGRFLSERPFAGRRPVAFGDDVTDEAMFAAVNRLGGLSIHIGDRPRRSAARFHLDHPAALRAMIAGLVGGDPATDGA